MTDRIHIRPPDFDAMSEDERFQWALAFVEAAAAAWLAETLPDLPEPDPED